MVGQATDCLPHTILPFLQSSGIGVDSSGPRVCVTSSLSLSWWLHSPLPCIQSPGLPCSHVTQYLPRKLKEDG